MYKQLCRISKSLVRQKQLHFQDARNKFNQCIIKTIIVFRRKIMKKSIKMLSILMAVVLSLGLFAGCGGSDDAAGSENETTAKQETTTNKEEKASESKSDEKFSLKLGHIMTPEHPNGQGAVKFAELVSEKTGGNVTVDVFPSSQLGNEKDIFDAVAMGMIDFSILGYGEPAKRFSPALIFDAPFFAEDREHLVRIFNDQIVKDIFADMAAETDVRAIGPFYYGTRYLTTSNKEVHGPEDMEGLKIRTPDQPIYVSTIKSMGATPVPMAFPEVYLALQQGVIDGQENPPATIATNKFYEVQSYLIKTAHIMGGNCIYVSDKVMDKLPAEYQNAIVEAGMEAADYINQVAFEAEDKYLKEIEANGVTIIEDVDRDAFIERANDLYAEYASKWGEGLLEEIRTID